MAACYFEGRGPCQREYGTSRSAEHNITASVPGSGSWKTVDVPGKKKEIISLALKKKVLLIFLVFFSWLFGLKMNFLRFIGPSVSLMD